MTVSSPTPDLERVAGALAECRERYWLTTSSFGCDVMDGPRSIPAFTGSVADCRAFIDLQCAKAAVMAMREPSDRMGAAGVRVQVAKSNLLHPSAMSETELQAVGFRDCLHGNPSRWMKPVWRAMIDAMLGETRA